MFICFFRALLGFHVREFPEIWKNPGTFFAECILYNLISGPVYVLVTHHLLTIQSMMEKYVDIYFHILIIFIVTVEILLIPVR